MKKFMISLFMVLMLCVSAVPAMAEHALYTLTINEDSTTSFYINGIQYEAQVADTTDTECGIMINGNTAWVNEGATTIVDGLTLSINSAVEVADGPSYCSVTFFGNSVWGDIPIILVVDDKSPAEDVITIVDIATELESDHNLDSTGKLNSEVTKSYLNDKVTMFVYYGKAVVIVDDDAPAIYVMIANDMAAMIKQMKGIEADVILVSEVPSDDLREIFGETEEGLDFSDCDRVIDLGEGESYNYQGVEFEVKDINVFYDESKVTIKMLDSGLTYEKTYGGKIIVDGVTIIIGETLAHTSTGEYAVELCLNYEEPDHIPCTDSDGGRNYYVRGHTIGFQTQAAPGYQNVDIWDKCAKDDGYDSSYDDKLFEYSCRDNYFDSETYTCPYGCSNGACLQKPYESDYDLGAYPKMFADLPDHSRYVVVGDQAPASNVVGAVDILTGLKDAGIEVGPAMLASEVSNVYDNFISVGNPCNNDVSDKLMGRPEPCTKGLADGIGQIRLKRLYDNYQIVVTGYSELDVRKASKVLANFDDYNLYGDCIEVYGDFDRPSIRSCRIYDGDEPEDEYDYGSGKPDLVITHVEHKGVLEQEYETSSFEIPKLRFAITLENRGDGYALLKHPTMGTTGIWGNINGEDVGWIQLVGEQYGEDDKYMAPGNARTYYWDYYTSGAAQHLELSNDFVLTADRVYDEEHQYLLPNGKVDESNENNNKYTYRFKLQPCKDTEDGASGNVNGMVTLYGVNVKDSYDFERKMVQEYWCKEEFQIGYGYRYPGSDIDEIEEYEEEVDEIEYIPVEECRGKGCPVEGTCVAHGIRILSKDTPVYCDFDGRLREQKEDSESCQNNYECLSNTCGNGECQDFGDRLSALEEEVKETRGIVAKILAWLGNIFRRG